MLYFANLSSPPALRADLSPIFTSSVADSIRGNEVGNIRPAKSANQRIGSPREAATNLPRQNQVVAPRPSCPRTCLPLIIFSERFLTRSLAGQCRSDCCARNNGQRCAFTSNPTNAYCSFISSTYRNDREVHQQRDRAISRSVAIVHHQQTRSNAPLSLEASSQQQCPRPELPANTCGA
jgi:hypothetical protein